MRRCFCFSPFLALVLTFLISAAEARWDWLNCGSNKNPLTLKAFSMHPAKPRGENLEDAKLNITMNLSKKLNPLILANITMWTGDGGRPNTEYSIDLCALAQESKAPFRCPLEPGDYTFQVPARDFKTIWGSFNTVIKIYTPKPFRRTAGNEGSTWPEPHKHGCVTIRYEE